MCRAANEAAKRARAVAGVVLVVCVAGVRGCAMLACWLCVDSDLVI